MSSCRKRPRRSSTDESEKECESDVEVRIVHGDGHEQERKVPVPIEEDVILLTPHTKRLLKLIEEGTASHAQMAASHLRETAARASPIVLWDLLGRLSSLLIRQTWTCRQHAQWAMQGVAQFLPGKDQHDFMATTTTGTSNCMYVAGVAGVANVASSDGILPQQQSNLWLTVEDLDIQLVLRRGRHMLAAPEQQYDDHDEEDRWLHQLNVSSSDFVHQRIQLQRRILAKRLGLGGLVQATGNLNEWLPDIITPQDFVSVDLSESPLIHTQSRVMTVLKDGSDNEDKSIRALLVLEMKQQHNNPSITSHRNPQHLLATELLYRMFDPHWHVRHGALLGVSSLLQTWKLKNDADCKSFGAWPHDILARCLCVLALDRFADFCSEAATAPVRLAAAHVVALLYKIAPDRVQKACRRILVTLATHYHQPHHQQQQHHTAGSWEVRYGGLLAMQFIVVVEKDVVEFTATAAHALNDPCDDVVGMAAQVLLVAGQMGATLPSCTDSLGEALLRVDSSVTSSTVPLLRLFVMELQRRQQLPMNSDKIWNQMLRFLDFPSSAIQISTLNAIPSMLESAATQKPSLPSQKTYSDLVVRVFDSFSEQNLYIDDAPTMSRLLFARQGALNALVALAPTLVVSGKELCLEIMLRLTDLNHGGICVKESAKLSALRDSCRVAAQIFASFADSVKPFLVVSILALLSSPRICHCEIATLLYRSLCQKYGDLVAPCRSTLQDLLLSASPACVLVERGMDNHHATRLYNAALLSIINDIAWKSETLDIVIEECRQIIETAHLCSSTCHRSIIKSVSTSSSVITSMRLSAMMAGSLVSGGASHIPETLTPLVRSLMTSLKSEIDPDRIDLTCEDLVALLKLLSCNGRNHVHDKILESICKLMMQGDVPTAMSATASGRIVENMIRDIPACDTVQVLSPIWHRLVYLDCANLATVNKSCLQETLNMLTVVGQAVVPRSKAAKHLITLTMHPLILTSCMSADTASRSAAVSCIRAFAKADSNVTLDKAIPLLAGHLRDMTVDSFRLGACKLMHSVVEEVDTEVCPFVHYLLPIAMSLMTDPVVECAKEASKIFALLVRVAPLVREVASVDWSLDMDDHAKSVMDHLILGKPLPPCIFPVSISNEMAQTGVTLRAYQAEGVAWLRFLQTVGLHGALCDSMGLGKTLEALVAIALAHDDSKMNGKTPVSIVVCPSSVVGHWIAEIRKFFPTVFNAIALIGNAKQRSKCWNDSQRGVSIVVTSYSVLRGDLERLKTTNWEYCVLDEGHLLKNPKTATARAAREIKSRHRLILTGTPVQNRVSELWATFDFLMPNFLGSHASFSKEFANPIGKGQQPGATAGAIQICMDKLKLLHQQVLPFILRREKEQVLKELPAKVFTDVPCSMTDEQQELYKSFCEGPEVQQSVSALQSLAESHENTPIKLGSNVLKSLLHLRLLCTHPSLVATHLSPCLASTQLQRSGKLQVLNELLRTAGVVPEESTGADNDTSAYYVDSETMLEEQDDFALTLQDHSNVPLTSSSVVDPFVSNTKCLIFAQFMRSLDVVEKYLFRTHMPSLRYLRLDGKVPNERRTEIVDAFNNDTSVQVLLLTTRVGGLGLNLTGANMVIFLEHDYNPFADLQAMDRAHRIGQTKTVNVYRLVATATIEEKIMDLQKAKFRMSNAIVNTNNSSMYSMGTDRLLDIFTFRGDQGDGNRTKSTLSHSKDLDDQDEEYHSLSVEEFVKEFLPELQDARQLY